MILGYTGASIIREQREIRRQLSSHQNQKPRSQSLPTVSASKLSDPGEDRKVRRRPPRRRKQVKVVEKTEEEEEETPPSHVIYPPHLHRSQWRRMTEMKHPASFVALINDVVGPDNLFSETLVNYFS